MKKVCVVLFAIYLGSTLFGCAASQKRDPWTATDHTLYTTALALHGADWLHTQVGLGKYGLEEKNVILGKNPDKGTVNMYFASTAVGLSALTWYAPKKGRRIILIGWNVLELISVLHNQTIGVQISFN